MIIKRRRNVDAAREGPAIEIRYGSERLTAKYRNEALAVLQAQAMAKEELELKNNMTFSLFDVTDGSEEGVLLGTVSTEPENHAVITRMLPPRARARVPTLVTSIS